MQFVVTGNGRARLPKHYGLLPARFLDPRESLSVTDQHSE
jgi:hypothetical protein